MSSARFPGKVLAPLAGRPIVAHVIDQAAQVVGRDRVMVLTSREPSDDPLACYVEHLGIRVFRGPLDDVFSRFQQGLAAFPADWFFRVNADSPLMNSAVMSALLVHAAPELDLVTNVQKRTFPPGHSVELLNARRFAALRAADLTLEEREHVTKYYYTHADQFHIVNIENTDAAYRALNFTVDTVDDLRRVAELERTTPYDFVPPLTISGPTV